MTEFFIGVFFVSFLIGALRYRSRNMELENALKVVLDAGICMEFRGYHLYKSRDDVYRILHFDKRGDILKDDEEEFDVSTDAIQKFVMRAKL